MKRQRKEYKVGYERPPKHCQFKKGQSGNPNGRPAGREDFAQVLARCLRKQITVNEGGRKNEVSLLDGLASQLCAKALNGYFPALRFVIWTIQSMEAQLRNAQDVEDRASEAPIDYSELSEKELVQLYQQKVSRNWG